MKDFIKIFGIKVPRKSLFYKSLRLLGKSGRVVGPIIAPKKFNITSIDIAIKDLPEGLDQLKIIHITDIHAGDYIRVNYIKKIVGICNSYSPDITVITGDFSETDNTDIDWCAKELSKLTAKYGLYGVLGNHDMWNGDEIITQTLTKNNIKILRNENVCIPINNNDLYLAGIDDYKNGNHDINKAMKDIPKDAITIMLSHNPDSVEILGNHKIDLMLCGHMHGGQWNFPIIGPPRVPSKFGKKHAWGLSQSQNTHIYTSNGIGTTFIPFRINCPPEITLLNLQKG